MNQLTTYYKACNKPLEVQEISEEATYNLLFKNKYCTPFIDGNVINLNYKFDENMDEYKDDTTLRCFHQYKDKVVIWPKGQLLFKMKNNCNTPYDKQYEPYLWSPDFIRVKYKIEIPLADFKDDNTPLQKVVQLMRDNVANSLNSGNTLRVINTGTHSRDASLEHRPENWDKLTKTQKEKIVYSDKTYEFNINSYLNKKIARSSDEEAQQLLDDIILRVSTAFAMIFLGDEKMTFALLKKKTHEYNGKSFTMVKLFIRLNQNCDEHDFKNYVLSIFDMPDLCEFKNWKCSSNKFK